MSSSARSVMSVTGSAAPRRSSNFPGSTRMTSALASAAPAVAASSNWCQATIVLAPELSRWNATSRSLSSGFIGTTTAPRRMAPKNRNGK